MSDHVAWLFELAVKPGRLESLTDLMVEMVESTRGEPGTLSYEWSLNESRDVCHIYERYSDSSATLAHMGTFGEKFAARFFSALSPTNLWVYGTPSDEVRKGLNGLGPVFMAPLGGFAR